MLYGIKLPLLFHIVTFLGKDEPSPSGYLSTDPNAIGDQLTAIERLGGAGVVALAYAPGSFPFQAAQEICRQCSERRLLFALMFDPWTVKNATDKNAAMVAAINHPYTQAMLNSRAYIPEHAVLDFSTGAQVSVPGVPTWMKHVDYSWPETTDPLGNLQKDNANTAMKMPCVFSTFNDGTTKDRNVSWQGGPVRIIESGPGSMYHSTVKAIPKTAKYVQYATMNDYYERTGIEPFAMMLTRGVGE